MDDFTANWSHKRTRCSICLWRGTWGEAASAPPVEPAEIDAAQQQLQDAYEEKERVGLTVGQPRPPRCPQCGHHLIIIARSSIRPAT